MCVLIPMNGGGGACTCTHARTHTGGQKSTLRAVPQKSSIVFHEMWPLIGQAGDEFLRRSLSLAKSTKLAGHRALLLLRRSPPVKEAISGCEDSNA